MKTTVRGLKSLDRFLKTESKRQEKALNTAVKVEGFRLMRLLKKEIREGAPGGKKFAPLSYLSRLWVGTRLRPDKPLRRLAIAVRYFVKDQSPFDMRIGWVGPKTSKSWKRIAEIQQEGFTRQVTPSMRGWLAEGGASLPKRRVVRKYFFLRKSTTRFKTRPRPIMDPFWRAHGGKAWRNIQRNYRLKMKGQRI